MLLLGIEKTKSWRWTRDFRNNTDTESRTTVKCSQSTFTPQLNITIPWPTSSSAPHIPTLAFCPFLNCDDSLRWPALQLYHKIEAWPRQCNWKCILFLCVRCEVWGVRWWCNVVYLTGYCWPEPWYNWYWGTDCQLSHCLHQARDITPTSGKQDIVTSNYTSMAKLQLIKFFFRSVKMK